MGSRKAMSYSWRRSANFIGRLHSAVLSCDRVNARVYPVMDGVFITSRSHRDMLSLVRAVLANLAFTFAKAKDDRHRFLVRGGLAFGHVVHGADIDKGASPIIAEAGSYRDSLLFGIPMIQAFEAEHHAPPFGVAIDVSARGFSEDGFVPLSGRWFIWHNQTDYPFMAEFKDALKKYFDWCDRHAQSMEYGKDRLLEHRNMAEEYFGEE